MWAPPIRLFGWSRAQDGSASGAPGADAHFTYLPDRTHFDVYFVDKDRQGLFDEIGRRCWETARPGQELEEGRGCFAGTGN